MVRDLDILVLEDETFIAMDVEETLRAAGYARVRICADPTAAFEGIEARRPDVALLDVNLGEGKTSFDVGRALMGGDCAIAFMTGYTSSTVDLPPDLADAPRLSKPFDDTMLVEFVKGVGAA